MNATFNISTVEDVEKLLKADCSNISCIDIKLFDGDKYNSKSIEALKLLTKNIKALKINNKFNVDINVLYERLPKDIFVYIVKFYRELNDKINFNICVKHDYEDGNYKDTELKRWDIEAIIKANLNIDKVCKFIKNSNFSPMEALAYIHLYVQNVAKYNSNGGREWCSDNQFFVGAFLKMPDVVCMGYATLMKEIIDNLDMPELNCEIVSVQFEHLKKDYKGKHARCFVAVKDEKYGIDQTFFDDPTWDDEECLKYAHFAMPNNCHDINISLHYDYWMPHFIKFNDTKNCRTYKYGELQNSMYNKSKNKLTQHDIEKIYFNVLQKMTPRLNSKMLYHKLQCMAKDSFNEQTVREYVGNLQQPNLLLTKAEAEKIYNNNLTKMPNNLEL